MTKIFSFTQPIGADIVDAYCALQKGFTDQFVYYRKDRPVSFDSRHFSPTHIPFTVLFRQQFYPRMQIHRGVTNVSGNNTGKPISWNDYRK